MRILLCFLLAASAAFARNERKQNYFARRFDHTAAERDAAIAETSRGFQLSATAKGDLASPADVPVALKKGACYVVAVKLADDASFSEQTRKHDLAFNLETPGDSLSSGPGVVGPGGVASFGCPGKGGKAIFHLGQRNEPLGTGTYLVQIFVRSAKGGEVQREKAVWAKSARDAERSQAQLKSSNCSECVQQKIDCHKRGGASCYDDYLGCVRSKGMRESDCGG